MIIIGHTQFCSIFTGGVIIVWVFAPNAQHKIRIVMIPHEGQRTAPDFDDNLLTHPPTHPPTHTTGKKIENQNVCVRYPISQTNNTQRLSLHTNQLPTNYQP